VTVAQERSVSDGPEQIGNWLKGGGFDAQSVADTMKTMADTLSDETIQMMECAAAARRDPPRGTFDEANCERGGDSE